MRWWTLPLALLLTASGAQAEPVVVASGAYPEGLLWHGGRLYFTEMGADRVSIIEESGTREFWHLNGCGPTQIVPFGPNGFVVDCHLGRAMVEVSATGQTGRRFAVNRSGERLQEALTKFAALEEQLPALWARDQHYLSKCHEVKSMTLCAELTFRAALMRTESRGFHFREDYPERDDKNWLKWIILQEEGGKIKLSTQPVPIGSYKIKPSD